MRRLFLMIALVLALAPPAQAAAAQRPATSERAAINALLDRFIPDVLRRENLAEGRKLVGGYVSVDTVQSYPARGKHFRGWITDFATPGDVGFDILLQPTKARQSLGAWSFRAEAQKLGGRWKITNWYPVATFAPPGKKPRVQGPADLQPTAAGQPGNGSHLGAVWLLAPVAVVCAFVLLGVVVGGRRVVRNRARARAIQRSLQSRS